MVTTIESKIDAANRALQEQNPFAQPPVVIAKHIWEDDSFPDIEALNAHASDAVFKALDEIRAGHYSTTSMLITADIGTGKSHVLSRIRRKLKQKGGTLFVLANRFDNLDEVREGFQKRLADSLMYEGAYTTSQWQEVASRIANISLETLHSGKTLSSQQLISKFTNSSVDRTGKWIQKLSDTFCRSREIKDPEVVKAILWCLSENQQPHAASWLGGEELAQYKAIELRLPSQRKSFDTVLQVLRIIGYFYELIICFDELDDPNISEQGLHTAQVVAGLIKELFENLDRGLILTTMMPGVWNERVRQLPGGVWNKVTAQGNPYELRYIDSQSMIELVEFYLDRFYVSRNIDPPHKLYPFSEDILREIGREKPTVREAIKWCKINCKLQMEEANILKSNVAKASTVEVDNDKKNDFEEAFQIEIQEDLKSYWEDNHFIGDSLLFSLGRLIGKEIEGVDISSVSREVGRRGGRDPYLNFKIYGKQSNSEVCIGVAVLQHNGGRGLGAGFRRLLDENNDFELSRGCLVRSYEKPLNSYFRKTYLEPLINEKGGEFVDLKLEDIQPLIAIYNIYRKKEEYDLTEEQIFEFIETAGPNKLLGVHSPLIREILSAPSEQVPDTADEPEIETSDPEALLEETSDNTSVSGDDSDEDLDLLDDDEEESAESDDLEDLVTNG